jgi:uncharacterized protein (TIGR02001 family)
MRIPCTATVQSPAPIHQSKARLRVSQAVARKLQRLLRAPGASFSETQMEWQQMSKRILTVAAIAALSIFSSAARADGLTANVALTSKYKFRGQDQSDITREAVPAIQGGFDYTLGSFYVGNWNSAIGGLNGTEMDLYAGYKGKVSVLDYDVGLLQYYYPGSGASDFNTTELYGQLGWNIVTLKYSLTVSNKYFGITDGRNTGYLDLSANYEVIKSLTLNGHIAQTRFSGGAKTAGAVNYIDYKIGATYDFGSGVTLAGAYVAADKKSVYGDINKGRVIVTLAKTL